jgi:hypothetical protein
MGNASEHDMFNGVTPKQHVFKLKEVIFKTTLLQTLKLIINHTVKLIISHRVKLIII